MAELHEAINRLMNWLDQTPEDQVIDAASVKPFAEDISCLLEAIDTGVGRDPRLNYINGGDNIGVFMLWSLQPKAPRIVAVCTSEVVCERYKSIAYQDGGKPYVESVILDHAFGRGDIQSVIFRAVTRDG